ncbi:hypothetical protein CTI12_AA486640 [Artemisia annua]|uniref:IBH1-like N-terminal domain-containing protein n=1 Tax=Artemisia annua TaxID=35608 RepID=A0A2U1LIU3_ARTAN|nr:hypothetical protein CTI12_AA486640 [Artemisia annua]
MSTTKKKMSRQYSCVRQQAMQSIRNNNESTSWKSKEQQELYRSKLVQALRQIQLSSSPLSGRVVREAANQVLAMTAKGHTRWSQAILTDKVIRKARRVVVPTMVAKRRFRKRRVGILRLKSKNLLAVQRKARDLRHLVPGCRKQPLSVVLDEVTDYICAVEMQVKAMATLADLFSSINQPPSSS